VLFVFSDFSRLKTVHRFIEVFEHPTWFMLFVLFVSGVFLIFNVIQLFQFLYALPRYIRLHIYFKKVLGINDAELSVLEWHEVIESIQIHEPDERKTLLAITQDILKIDNFICALVSDPSILTWRVPWKKQVESIPMTEFFLFVAIDIVWNCVGFKNG